MSRIADSLRALGVVGVLFVWLPASAAWAQAAGQEGALAAPVITTIDRPRNVLFVGNSFSYYNNSLHAHVRSLAQAAGMARGKGSVFRSMTISGGFLHQHAGGLPAMLEARRWDVVVLQGQSTEPMASNARRAARFKSTVRRYDHWIRKAGAKTALYMTWAFRGRPQMMPALAKAYVDIGNEVGALVVPVGLAFERARQARPELVLHHSDDQHPSLAGTYLAACVFYAALYGQSPVNNSYIAGLAPGTASYLQEQAWQTVASFRGMR